MKITIVQIRAFDRDRSEVFYNNTPEEIHDTLTNICNTYVPLAIIDVVETKFEPLNTLTKFRTED